MLINLIAIINILNHIHFLRKDYYYSNKIIAVIIMGTRVFYFIKMVITEIIKVIIKELLSLLNYMKIIIIRMFIMYIIWNYWALY